MLPFISLSPNENSGQIEVTAPNMLVDARRR
jgi:membrane-bound lytic murein transglycosylase F